MTMDLPFIRAFLSLIWTFQREVIIGGDRNEWCVRKSITGKKRKSQVYKRGIPCIREIHVRGGAHALGIILGIIIV